jgi:Xaa-Pro aminopeptidase
MADGLSHGMRLLLESILAATRFEGSLTSAAPLCAALRGRKTGAEVSRIRAAIESTEQLFAGIGCNASTGRTERELFDAVQADIHERGLETAWDSSGCPIVNTGPDSMQGHGVPSDRIRIAPGHILHVDLGVRQQGYCSDMQRCWYVPFPGATQAPPDALRAMQAVTGAISAGAAALRPGVRGCDVDRAAREYLVNAGYSEYLHALGHQVGRFAHDGGCILGPEWERYGETPRLPVEEGQVYTLELGVNVDGRGYLGIEEMVLVNKAGCEWLTTRQMELPPLSSPNG